MEYLKNLKYLVAGAGGVGGNIAAFLKLEGKDVTCIARGPHLASIQEHGLRLNSDLKGKHLIPIPACTDEEYNDKADVIFVCVKGYSIDSILQLIRRAAHKDTIVIPVLNVYGTGPKLKELLPDVNVLDGCIYIVGYISAPGEISQMGSTFRIVFGTRNQSAVSRELLEAVQKNLIDSGIKTEISDDINRDTFIKWSFISAMACSGAYFDAPMGYIQSNTEARELFAGLSRESAELGKKLGITFEGDLVNYNLKVLDNLDPESTASMQKDLARGHESEIDGLLFSLIEMAHANGVQTPTYDIVSQKFKSLK